MLIDTNILLSAILMQNDYKNSVKLLEEIKESNITIYTTWFSIYSICIELHRRKEFANLSNFISNFTSQRNIKIYHTTTEDILRMNTLDINLDFDDKLHYYLAKKKNLQLVSYDADFDKTDLKRMTPKEALEQLGID